MYILWNGILASGAIKGIGPKMAHKIVGKFKEDTFRIIEEEPERLAEIKGISERKAQEIYKQFHDKQDMRQATMFLAKYGISSTYAIKIYNQYGSRLYDIIREKPLPAWPMILRASDLSLPMILPIKPVSQITAHIGFASGIIYELPPGNAGRTHISAKGIAGWPDRAASWRGTGAH